MVKCTARPRHDQARPEISLAGTVQPTRLVVLCPPTGHGLHQRLRHGSIRLETCRVGLKARQAHYAPPCNKSICPPPPYLFGPCLIWFKQVYFASLISLSYAYMVGISLFCLPLIGPGHARPARRAKEEAQARPNRRAVPRLGWAKSPCRGPGHRVSGFLANYI